MEGQGNILTLPKNIYIWKLKLFLRNYLAIYNQILYASFWV